MEDYMSRANREMMGETCTIRVKELIADPG